MHRVGAAPADVPALVARIAAAAPARAPAPASSPTSPSPTSSTTRTPPASWRVRRGARRRSRRTCWTRSSCTPPTRPAALAHPAARRAVRARRHRDVRHLARRRRRRPRRRAAPGAVAQGPGVVRQAAAGRGRGCRTACATSCPRDANVATVPLGYADGVRRGLSNVGDVLIGGRRRRIVGSVTMDQLMVDCGDDDVRRRRRGGADRPPGRRADHAPRSGPATSARSATRSSCGIGPRVPRRLIGAAPAAGRAPRQ